MSHPRYNSHDAPPPAARSWSTRDVLAYLRGLVAEGVRYPADGSSPERVEQLCQYLDDTFKSAPVRERQEASLLFKQLTTVMPTNGGGGVLAHGAPGVAGAGGSGNSGNGDFNRTSVENPHRHHVDATQRRLTAAQAERELLPIIYEGGWFGALAQCVANAQAPPAYFFGAALTIAAAAFAARPRIVWEQGPLYTNLYTVLVGASGTGKSTAVEWVQSVMQPALGNYLLGNDGTPQGFMAGLHARWEQTRLCADGLIIADEYKVLIGREKHKEQLVTFLTACYGKQGPFDRLLGSVSDKYYFENPRVSVLAGTTMEWWRSSHEDAVLGGYVPRHFIFESVADKWTDDMNAATGAPRDGSAHPLTAMLRDICLRLPETITLTADAWAYVNWWRNNEVRHIYDRETDLEVRAWLRRKPTGVLKVATICHLINRHTGGVCLACAHWARRVVDWQDYGVRRVYSDLSKNRLARLTKKVIEVIAASGAGGATTGLIRRELRHGVKRKEIEEILSDLQKESVLTGVLDMGNDMVWRLR